MTPTQQTMSRADIAQQLRDLSDAMLDVAASLEYFGGNDGEMIRKTRMMLGASALMQVWAGEVAQ